MIEQIDEYTSESISDEHDPRRSEEFLVVYENKSENSDTSEKNSDVDPLVNLRADSAPFIPSKVENSDSSDKEIITSNPEVELTEAEKELQVKQKLQSDELNRVIKIMKTQHQYINNLQQANLNLKSQVKKLDELKSR